MSMSRRSFLAALVATPVLPRIAFAAYPKIANLKPE
jgi:hypothetical protein